MSVGEYAKTAIESMSPEDLQSHFDALEKKKTIDSRQDPWTDADRQEWNLIRRRLEALKVEVPKELQGMDINRLRELESELRKKSMDRNYNWRPEMEGKLYQRVVERIQQLAAA